MGIFRNRQIIDTTSAGTREAEKGFVQRSMTEQQTGPWKVATVVEVLNDPNYFYDKYYQTYYDAKLVDEQEEFFKYPRNTLLVSVEGDNIGSKLIPCIPFYGSHLGMPIKVGESVWISDDGSKYSHWHCRVGTEMGAEEVGLAIKDRKYTDPIAPVEDGKAKSGSGNNKFALKSLFVNQQDPNKSALNATKNDKNAKAKEKEQQGAPETPALRPIEERLQMVLEPVPRWTPRQGDYYIQGSNNTLISLGTDRGWPIDTTDFGRYSNANDLAREKSGSIDIVVGRGQYISEPTEENRSGTYQGTAPATIYTEDKSKILLDQNSLMSNVNPNMQEGDPCFETDLSRVYVSMDTAVDKNFYPGSKFAPLYLGVPEDKQGPSIAMQTTHFRIYAKDSGDIRIVKQGDPQGTTQASIILHADGTVSISGDKILIGRKEENNDRIDGSEYTAQPWVKYSNLGDYFEEFHKILNKFMKQVQVNRSPGHFATDVVLKNAAATFNREQEALFNDKFKLIQSDRIWGE